MTQAHTPGPWKESPDGWINGENGTTIIEYAGCGSHQAYWVNDADKNLVLAAPELLEALEAVVPLALVGQSALPEGHEEAAKIIAQMDAAIAKARGSR